MVVWWVGNAVLFVLVIPVVTVLAHRLTARAREFERAAREVAERAVPGAW